MSPELGPTSRGYQMRDNDLNEFFQKMMKCMYENHPGWCVPNSNFVSFRQEGYLHLMNISFDFSVSPSDVMDLEIIPENMQVKRRLSVVD